MILSITTYPNKILRQVTLRVDEVTDEIKALCKDMMETMCAARGVGLAANQVGVPLRILIVETGTEKKSRPLAIINPEILHSEGEEAAEEGCLSIPSFYEVIKRAKKIILKGTSTEGSELTLDCEGLLARACQHEIDHLNGVLFIDHLSPIKKKLFKKEYTKEKK
jgi:peptide deformylase